MLEFFQKIWVNGDTLAEIKNQKLNLFLKSKKYGVYSLPFQLQGVFPLPYGVRSVIYLRPKWGSLQEIIPVELYYGSNASKCPDSLEGIAISTKPSK